MLRSTRVRWLLFVFALAACQNGPPPPPPEAQITPIQLSGESAPILFQEVVFRIPAGTRLGAWYWRDSDRQLSEIRWSGQLTKTSEFNVSAIDRLKQHGYTAVDPSRALFTDEDHVKTRFRLGGVVTRAEIEGHVSRPNKNSHAVANLDMEVTLYDAVLKQTVYQRQVTGWGADTGQDPRPLGPAVLNALDKALTDPAFAALVVKPKNEHTFAGAESIPIPGCDGAGRFRLPRDLESVRSAVMTLHAGAATGSAVMISSEGHALTAAHVVAGLDEVRAVLASGLELPAKVLRVDPEIDAALIQVAGRQHDCVEVGAEPKVGADIYLIGSTFGSELPLSVSKGIVSGHREVEGVQLIQTDAAANAGNSGGPLLDGSGRVGGILTAKTFGMGIEGLAFALPVDLVRERLALSWSQASR